MKLLKINHNGIEVISLELVDGAEYIAGRDESCQIRLQDSSISRRHFRVFQDGGDWKIENISKFGKLLQGGAPVTIGTIGQLSAFAVPPYQISLFEKTEDVNQELPTPSEGFPQEVNAGLVPADDDALQNSILRIAAQAPPTDASQDQAMDKTWVAEMGRASNPDQGLHIAGYLTISEPGQEDALWKLDRNPEGEDQWIVGRDTSCQVQVVGAGVSRKHFEIRQRGGEFSIADLKSSKGTILNGVKLQPRAEVPFRSGDSVEFANSMARFELRDENFEKGLSNLPVPFEPMGTSIQTMDMQVFQQTQQNQELLVAEVPGGDEDTNDVPYFMGPVPIQGGYPSTGFPDGFPQLGKKKNNPLLIRVIIGIGAVALVGYQLFSEDSAKENDSNSQTKTQASKDPLTLLTKEQKEDLETSYRFADTLMKRNNYQAALRELEKIHELVPNFKNSKKFEADCQRAIEAQQKREQMQAENKRMAETKKKINDIVESCRRLSERSQDIAAVQSCLTPALELDPSNSTAQEMIMKMEAARAARERAMQAATAHRHNVGSGEGLYQRATQLKGSGRLLLAVQAYESHIRSGYPDPKNLKEDSKRQIASIKSDIQIRIENAMKKAQELSDNQKYKESVKQLDRALDLDPENTSAAELRSSITADLYKKMKVIYSDSVLEENLGRIEEAKEKWKQIIATDIDSGEYFQKAKSKLAKYGER